MRLLIQEQICPKGRVIALADRMAGSGLLKELYISIKNKNVASRCFLPRSVTSGFCSYIIKLNSLLICMFIWLNTSNSETLVSEFDVLGPLGPFRNLSLL